MLLHDSRSSSPLFLDASIHWNSAVFGLEGCWLVCLFMAAIVEYAKSGRSQCCVCCQKITLDAIRFRMPLEQKWRCLECFKPVEHQSETAETEIECHGAAKLSSEDQLLLAELLQTRLKGARLGALWLRSEEHRGLRQCAREWARSETESDSASSRVEKPRTKKRRIPDEAQPFLTMTKIGGAAPDDQSVQPRLHR